MFDIPFPWSWFFTGLALGIAIGMAIFVIPMTFRKTEYELREEEADERQEEDNTAPHSATEQGREDDDWQY